MKGDIKQCFRDVLRQVYDANDIRIMKGVVSNDHLHISYLTKISVIEIVKRPKGRSSLILISEYPELHKHYLEKHFCTIGYGTWGKGHIMDEMIDEYIGYYRDDPNNDKNLILE